LRSQPGSGASAKALLFASIDRFSRTAMSIGASTLDLDEDQQRPASCHEIDLDSIGAYVPRDDAISSRLEESGG
jgi:hypothetical protein